MPKRVLTGVIVSDKGEKTVVVNVERKVRHALYGKIIRRSKKYHAHDEGNEFKQGETVRIEEIAPMSKLKTWKVLDRVNTHALRRTGPGRGLRPGSGAASWPLPLVRTSLRRWPAPGVIILGGAGSVSTP
jgi:small subunit ribosomal protein S17